MMIRVFEENYVNLERYYLWMFKRVQGLFKELLSLSIDLFFKG